MAQSKSGLRHFAQLSTKVANVNTTLYTAAAPAVRAAIKT